MKNPARAEFPLLTSLWWAWRGVVPIVLTYYDGNMDDLEAEISGYERSCLILFRQIERRLEAVVDGHLIAGNELVGLVGHADHLLEFLEHFRRHAFAESRGGVRSDAVVAVVGDADGDVEQFLGERVESAGSHDGLEAFPGALQKNRIVGDGFPEIVDVIGFARGHDVVIDSFDGGTGIFVFDQTESGHENCSMHIEFCKEWYLEFEEGGSR
jgi:hypothetical protein